LKIVRLNMEVSTLSYYLTLTGEMSLIYLL